MDGLWVRLRGGTKRVTLMLVDSVSGVIWPPVVAFGEEHVAGVPPGEISYLDALGV